MRQARPPLPRRAAVIDGRALARFVQSEDELDAMLAFVERTSLPPELPVEPRMFEPPSFEDRSERLDLDTVVARLSSSPAPAGMMHTRRRTDPTLAGRRVDMDEVLGRISMTPSINLTPSEPPRPRTTAPLPSWPRFAMVAASAFLLGSALTYLAG